MKQLSQGNRLSYDVCFWLVDEVDELKKMKKPMGHKALVIHTGNVYMSDSKGVWYCITQKQSSSGGTNEEESDPTIWVPFVEPEVEEGGMS